MIAKGPVSLLVTIDKTTLGYRRNEGISQYNEFTPLRLLVASGTKFVLRTKIRIRNVPIRELSHIDWMIHREGKSASRRPWLLA